MKREKSTDEPDMASQLGRWMIIALWLLLLGFGTWFAQNWLERNNRAPEPVSTRDNDGHQSVTIDADKYGHYRLAGKINGQRVEFLVDTGATMVSLPFTVAERLGLQAGLTYPVTTANGTIRVRATHLNTLSVGNLHQSGVQASINSAMDGEVILLGMSFLRHFELIQKSGQLTIRKP